MLSFGLCVLVRSGAETGGGTTATFAICTGELDSSRLTAPGAGGITFAARVGVERELSRFRLGAGATTDGLRDGAVKVRSRDTFGAGGITAGPKAGATRVWSFETLGAGGMTLALRLGALTGRSRGTDGAGAITASSRDSVARVVANHVRSRSDYCGRKIGRGARRAQPFRRRRSGSA